MADVKWIKITTDVFDDEKILLIESLPEADSIIVIWFKLLCLAGKQNNSGVFLMGDKIAYTDKMLATIFRRKEAIVQLALQTFEQFGMIELIDGVITIPNWEKHQNIDQLDKIKEQTRQRVARHRQKQKVLCDSNVTGNDTSNVTVTVCNATDKNREDKIRLEKEKNKEKNICQQIADMFNHLCPSFPSVKSLSKARKEMINDSLDTYTIEDFEAVFKKAEESDFLKGSNDKNWTANFDWMIKDANMAKILDGNYDNHKKVNKNSFHNFNQRTYDAEAYRRIEEKSREPIKPADPERIKAIQERLKES